MTNTKFLAAILTIVLSTTTARADFDRWSVDSESDPFSGGTSVSADYFFSIRNGVLILCDSARSGLTIRMIPGWRAEEGLDGYEVIVERNFALAVDGKIVPVRPSEASVGTVGDLQTAADVILEGKDATLFIKAFSGAKSQIAFNDGISDSPYLASASGSTSSAQKLDECLSSQGE